MLFLFDKETEYRGIVFKDLELSQKELSSKEFDNCSFIDCAFNEKAFINCSFYDCKFKNCNMSLIKVKGCSFCGTIIFEDSKLTGIDWTEVSWSRIEIPFPIQFLNCNISYSTFIGLNLREIRIKECYAREVDFMEANMTQADFTNTDFTGSVFDNTNLTRADFSHAKNYNINVGLNKVKKTKFSLPEAISLLYFLDIELVECD